MVILVTHLTCSDRSHFSLLNHVYLVTIFYFLNKDISITIQVIVLKFSVCDPRILIKVLTLKGRVYSSNGPGLYSDPSLIPGSWIMMRHV